MRRGGWGCAQAGVVSLEERAEVCARLDRGQLHACVAVHTEEERPVCAHVEKT